MNEDKDTRQQVEEDAQEDLELKDEEAEKVAGGTEFTIKKVTDKSSPILFD